MCVYIYSEDKGLRSSKDSQKNKGSCSLCFRFFFFCSKNVWSPVTGSTFLFTLFRKNYLLILERVVRTGSKLGTYFSLNKSLFFLLF